MPKYCLFMPQAILRTLRFMLYKADNDHFAGNQNNRANYLPNPPSGPQELEVIWCSLPP